MDDARRDILSRRLEEALLAVDRTAVSECVAEVVTDSGFDPVEFADFIVTPAFERMGRGWETNEVSLSQTYMAGRLMDEALTRHLPPQTTGRGPVIGVVVFEDFHALGKRMVQTLLQCAGYDVRDLGTGATAAQIVERVASEGVEILMVSVLMFNKALHITKLSEALQALGPRRPLLVVGGAPFVFDRDLWRRVGADVGGASAADALRIVTQYVEARAEVVP